MESEEEFRPKYVEFLTDLMYTRCTDRFAKILANHSVPTYEYSFEYRGQYSIVNLQGEQVDRYIDIYFVGSKGIKGGRGTGVPISVLLHCLIYLHIFVRN